MEGDRYVEDGYVEVGYVEETVPVVVPPPGETDFDLSLGTVLAPRHRTALGSSHLLDLIYWPPTSPWAPYDTEPLFAIQTWMGLYVWSKVRPPQALLDAHHVQHTETTLIEVGPIAHRSTALGQGLLGSVSAVERPTSYVTIYDEFGEFLKRFDVEIFAGMPAGYFTLVKRIWLIPRLTGTVGEIEVDVSRQIVRIPYGQFARQEP